MRIFVTSKVRVRMGRERGLGEVYSMSMHRFHFFDHAFTRLYFVFCVKTSRCHRVANVDVVKLPCECGQEIYGRTQSFSCESWLYLSGYLSTPHNIIRPSGYPSLLHHNPACLSPPHPSLLHDPNEKLSPTGPPAASLLHEPC